MYFSRFELSIPDRNRHAPDRLIPFPISRNTDFVFPSDFSVPDQEIQLRERLRVFPTVPDRFHPRHALKSNVDPSGSGGGVKPNDGQSGGGGRLPGQPVFAREGGARGGGA